MDRLKGKTAIVTGASGGMGRAIALALAVEGANVVVVARSASGLEETARLASEKGVQAVALTADVAAVGAVKSIVHQVVERFGTVDLLVNNAGTNTVHRNLADTSVSDWARVVDTNLTGAFLFTREVLPYMRREKRGQIVNISSGVAFGPTAMAGVAYCASKSGLHSLTASTNLEERRHGIRACTIAPGETNTPNLELRPVVPPEEARQKMLRAEDIARAVLFVATQPDRVAVELLVLSPTVQRNGQADYERYVADGHTALRID